MIELKRLSKAYRQGSQVLPILRDIDVVIGVGEFVAIMGPSGSGKSTLLNVLGLLDDYDGGEYWLDGVLIRQPSERQAAHYRNRLIGFVFQAFHLLPFLQVWPFTPASVDLASGRSEGYPDPSQRCGRQPGRPRQCGRSSSGDR